jgi:hypothetical protein
VKRKEENGAASTKQSLPKPPKAKESHGTESSLIVFTKNQA